LDLDLDLDLDLISAEMMEMLGIEIYCLSARVSISAIR